MNLTLRATLLSIFLSLLAITFSVLGFSAYYYGRESAESLLAQVLDEVSRNIEGRLLGLVDMATDQTALDLELLRSGALQAEDPRQLVDYWHDVMRVKPRLSFVYFTDEQSGSLVGVRRDLAGELYIQEVRTEPESDRLVLREFHADLGEYPDTACVTEYPGDRDYKARTYYRAAVEAGRQTWTKTYVFLGPPGIPGASNAAPFFSADGTLEGVVATDVDARGLCGYLADISRESGRLAFVVELLGDGERAIVAHPDASLLASPGSKTLMDPAEVADPRVRRFMQQVPPGTVWEDNAPFQPVEFVVDGVDHVGGYRYLAGQETPDWLVGIVLPRDVVMEHVHRNRLTMLNVGLVALVIALTVTLYVARQVSRPLEAIATDTEAIARLEIEPRAPVRSVVLEVDRLGNAMEEMKTGLRSFTKYVPEPLVRSLIASGVEAAPGGEARTITISFSDIVGFTSISEGLAPGELFDHLGTYFTELSRVVREQQGTVDKYIGDSIMAFWGAPHPDPQHALNACKAALSSQAALRELRVAWKAAGRPPFEAGFGLNTGEVIVGNLGSDRRLNYTIIGDAVNLASRLEGLNRIFGTSIVISQSTYEEVRSDVVVRLLDRVAVKGRRTGVDVYELLGLTGQAGPEELELIGLYSAALEDYRRQRWDAAIRGFEQVLELRREDGPAAVMRVRCHEYRKQGPGDDWDGIHRMLSK